MNLVIDCMVAVEQRNDLVREMSAPRPRRSRKVSGGSKIEGAHSDRVTGSIARLVRSIFGGAALAQQRTAP